MPGRPPEIKSQSNTKYTDTPEKNGEKYTFCVVRGKKTSYRRMRPTLTYRSVRAMRSRKILSGRVVMALSLSHLVLFFIDLLVATRTEEGNKIEAGTSSVGGEEFGRRRRAEERRAVYNECQSLTIARCDLQEMASPPQCTHDIRMHQQSHKGHLRVMISARVSSQIVRVTAQQSSLRIVEASSCRTTAAPYKDSPSGNGHNMSEVITP